MVELTGFEWLSLTDLSGWTYQIRVASPSRLCWLRLRDLLVPSGLPAGLVAMVKVDEASGWCRSFSQPCCVDCVLWPVATLLIGLVSLDQWPFS